MAKWMDLRHTYNLKGKLLLSCLGVVCIALGTTVCRVGNVGVDPFTAMNLGFSARVGMDFGTFQLLVNLAILAAVFALDKYQIGLGTLINMVGVGYLIELFTWLLGFLPKFEGLVSAGVHLVVGTLLFTLGVSLYLKTRMGVAPIDAIAPIAAERLPFSYTACRMTQDISVTVLAVLAGVPSRRHEGRGLRDDRQEGPHVHSLSFVPGTRLLVAVDLGLDALVIYQVDACGMLAPTAAETVRVPAGSGPRIVAYHPRLPMAALVNELACDVLVFRIDEGGLHWRIVEQLSLPQAPSGDALAAHIAFSPDGRQLYASVRGSDQLVVFPVDGQGRVAGRCDVASGGKGPRHFSLSPDGRFLAVANLASDDVRLFERDADGMLRAVACVDVPQPACVIWDA